MTTKVLNLYAGIGGNRKRWDDVDVTAVEINDLRAEIYADEFPSDEVVIGDAHEYLLEHFDEFDFIWTSPPCPTHSKIRLHFNVRADNSERGGDADPKYPDMRLYQEVIFLKHHFDGDWVVENVEPYYEPLIPYQKCGRHAFWSNFSIPDKEINHNIGKSARLNDLEQEYGYDLSDYTFSNIGKVKTLKNCVHPELGEHVCEAATSDRQTTAADWL